MRTEASRAPSPSIPTIACNEFLTRLDAKAAEKRAPMQATIELTYGCNLRCVHCYNPTHTAKGELTTDQVCGIIDHLAEEECFQVAFTGGELLTRKDCFEVFDHAKEKGLSIVLLTNATMLTPEKADRIQALKPRSVDISIYGATAETYESVTRIPGSFKRFVRGVELLRQRKVPLIIKMAVMILNRHEVQQARALVESWRIPFVYSTEIHPRVDGSLEPLNYRLAPQDVIRVNEQLLGYRQWSAEGGGEKEEGCGGKGGMFTCDCGKTNLAVTPYGEVNLCLALPIPRYDLRSGDVASGWRTLVNLVESTRPSEAYECPSCTLEPYCCQGPMDAWLETGDLNPCLPYFRQLAALQKQAHEAATARGHRKSNQAGRAEGNGSGTTRSESQGDVRSLPRRI